MADATALLFLTPVFIYAGKKIRAAKAALCQFGHECDKCNFYQFGFMFWFLLPQSQHRHPFLSGRIFFVILEAVVLPLPEPPTMRTFLFRASLVVLMAKLIVLFSTSSCMGVTVLSCLHQGRDEEAKPDARCKKHYACPHGQSKRMAGRTAPSTTTMRLCSSKNSASLYRSSTVMDTVYPSRSMRKKTMGRPGRIPLRCP